METDNEQLDEFLKKQKREAEERASKKRAQKHDLDYLDLVSTTTPTEIEAMEVVSEEDAKEGKLVPVQISGKKLVVTVYNPNNKKAKEVIKNLKENYDVTVMVSSMSGLKYAWGFYEYIQDKNKEIGGKVTVDSERIKKIKDDIDSIEDLENKIESFDKPQTSQIMEIVVAGAMSLKASDIHMEPTEEKNIVRFRIDGILHTVSDKVSDKIHNSLVTRIKLLSGLKLNVKDEPQDGRFTLDLPDRDIELRTSIIPSEYGETIVMRLLDPNAIQLELKDLGWRQDDLTIVEKQLKKPNGLILNTGPTGSGKTTTLYAFLKKITTSKIKVITVEDPIEYHLEGISQTQVDHSTGYTFAKGLRSIVRQDPDAILVGEIRDEETAGIALNASLTGHMVFSTLHTNSAVGAIPRLLDLGAKPNVLAPALSLIIAQRLVRKLCKSCKKKIQIKQEREDKINKFLDNLPDRVDKEKYQDFEIYEAQGCEECNDLGYKGRTSIFELFEAGDKVEEIIHQNPRESELKKLAKNQGMVEMQEDGVLKILKGITSFEEVERLTGPVEWL